MNIEQYKQRVLFILDRQKYMRQAEKALTNREQETTSLLAEWLTEQLSWINSDLIVANMEIREAEAGMLVHVVEQPYLTQCATVDLEMFGVERKAIYTYARWCLEDKQYDSARALLKLADVMLAHERSELRQVSAMVNEAEEADKPNP